MRLVWMAYLHRMPSYIHNRTCVSIVAAATKFAFLLTQYKLVPNFSWGTIYGTDMTAWSANGCDYKSCFYWDAKYGNAIPTLWKASYDAMRCGQVVNGKHNGRRQGNNEGAWRL